MFTFANVERVAQATADYWSANPVAGTETKVIVGYDRRFLSDEFARRTAEVFAGNGFQVVADAEPTPTPSVSFAVKAQRAIGGVMITASHNPPHFNGFKLKSHYGGSARVRHLPGGRGVAGSEPGPQRLALAEAVKARAVLHQGCRAAHYAAQKAGGFQAHRQIQPAVCA